MPMVSLRISEEEKRRLTKHGKLSESMRRAIRLYLDSSDSEEVFEKLGELQRRSRVLTTPEEMVKLIREDRRRDSGR
jgi:hypothetical protein